MRTLSNITYLPSITEMSALSSYSHILESFQPFMWSFLSFCRLDVRQTLSGVLILHSFIHSFIHSLSKPFRHSDVSSLPSAAWMFIRCYFYFLTPFCLLSRTGMWKKIRQNIFIAFKIDVIGPENRRYRTGKYTVWQTHPVHHLARKFYRLGSEGG